MWATKNMDTTYDGTNMKCVAICGATESAGTTKKPNVSAV